MKRLSSSLYGLILCLLYSAAASGALLGFLRLYRPAPVIILTLILFALSFWWYQRAGFAPSQAAAAHPWLDGLVLLAGLGMFTLLVLLPLSRWPYSPVSETLQWDAGIYHFPKAIEMLKTGSAWDFTIAYGEYPFGYESILALALTLTGSVATFGPVHALIALYLLLTVWLLARRFTHLPSGVLLFLTSALLVSGMLNTVESNPWGILQPLLVTIGKNDLLLAAALLSAIYFAPIGRGDDEGRRYSLPGLALASVLALATKPNALYVLLPLWAWTLYHAYRSKTLPTWPEWAAAGAALLTGLLWALRNLIGLGGLVSSGSAGLIQRTIAGSLANPLFSGHLPLQFLFLCALAVIALVLVLIRSALDGSLRTIAAAYLALFLGFIVTPASVSLEGGALLIGWRFGAAALIFAFLLLLSWGDALLGRLLLRLWDRRALAALAALAALLLAAGFTWSQRDYLKYIPANGIVLRDQFRQPVGRSGYFSAYDYIQKNVRDSVVWVENGLPYYVYGPGFSNTTTRQQKASYLVVFQTAWFGGSPAYPEFVADPTWQQAWVKIYEDPQGRVYRRK